MNTEMRSTSVIKLFDLEITKRVFVDDEQCVQFFDFTYQGIPCTISTYGLNFGNKNEIVWRKRYAGFSEVWNHCAYMILTERQLSYVDPQFIIDINTPVEEDNFWHTDYASNVFKHDEVTYTEKQDDGTYKVGIDYQHSHNNANNTDLLTVMANLMLEVDEMLDEHHIIGLV